MQVVIGMLASHLTLPQILPFQSKGNKTAWSAVLEVKDTVVYKVKSILTCDLIRYRHYRGVWGCPQRSYSLTSNYKRGQSSRADNGLNMHLINKEICK